MGVYVYCIKEDYRYQSSIKGRNFENKWFRLEPDGTIIVKGTRDMGYAWDGCSPKWKWKEMFFGTPEAILNYETRHSKTYYASLIHDVFYQFNKDVAPFVKRAEVDREFYAILKRDGFGCAGAYYRAVRLFGWVYWEDIMKNAALTVAGTVFLIAAFLHLLRVICKTEVMIGGFAAPLWLSTAGFIIALALGLWMFKARR